MVETHRRVIAGRWEGQAIFKYICSAEMIRYVVCSYGRHVLESSTFPQKIQTQ